MTLDPARYESDISALLTRLQYVQKPHGGWGYPRQGNRRHVHDAIRRARAAREATQAGFQVPRPVVVERVTNWLLKTRARGYLGLSGHDQHLERETGQAVGRAAQHGGRRVGQPVHLPPTCWGFFRDKIKHNEDVPQVLLRSARLKKATGGPGQHGVAVAAAASRN